MFFAVGLKAKSEEYVGATKCACVPLKQCEWGKKIFQRLYAHSFLTLQQLKITSLERQIEQVTGRSFTIKRRCSKKNDVFCCNNMPGGSQKFVGYDYPTEKQIETQCNSKPKSTSKPKWVVRKRNNDKNLL